MTGGATGTGAARGGEGWRTKEPEPWTTLGVAGRCVDGGSLDGGPAFKGDGADGAPGAAADGGAWLGTASAIWRGSEQETASDSSVQPATARKPNERTEVGLMPVDRKNAKRATR